VDQSSAPRKRHSDYGIDAPGLVRFFALAGSAALCCAFLIIWLFASQPIWPLAIGAVLGTLALYLLGMGGFMLYWSKVTKIKARDNIIDQVRWRGDETVLDIGCGRGLMLVAAAKRLITGRAVGIDIWRSADQSNNSAEAALTNASNEGVGERIDIVTGDMRRLPFSDQSFDIVVSHWVVHNLPSKADRDGALEEMARVLRHGGQIILADIENRDDYATTLESLGFVDLRLIVDPLKDQVLRAVSFGSFGPATHVARKTEEHGASHRLERRF
jgi:arsenite methyltransferase